MTETLAPRVTTLPTARHPDRPFDPPAELAAIRERYPLVRMTYPDGHDGWLATGYQAGRAILADRRFSSRYELMHLPMPIEGAPAELPPAPVGDLTGIDPPHHTRLRRLLVGYFTVRRMRALSERVEEITAARLDGMQRQGPPVDLVTAFASPIPALVICELLGVPYADRDTFQRHVYTLTDLSSAAAARGAAMEALHTYLLGLVRTKRSHPGDDILSSIPSSALTDDELAGTGAFLLGAGLDTTANMLGLGTFALLRHPDQLAVLRSDRGIVDGAVEELLRYLTITHTNIRAALEDVEVEGQLIRAGETVTISMQAANRDPVRYPDPDVLDLRRRATGHLTLGHGIHQCLGQQLARVEMRVAFPALLTRFPALRLDCEPADVPLRTHSNIYGVHHLPVSW
ncbi:cytochrome P450 [Pseudonocardia adelaidensis]|uniref:Cytochrome P450 n=1 Tax=Pseudonocardia adelaidensis TaxID=648754 RepID=A0ABP9P3S1_9PSEU